MHTLLAIRVYALAAINVTVLRNVAHYSSVGLGVRLHDHDGDVSSEVGVC